MCSEAGAQPTALAYALALAGGLVLAIEAS
jgi:hypothetical protein